MIKYLRSMTGFGSALFETEDFSVHVEIKSVNQRYLEVQFHMPHVLSALEAKLRRTIAETLSRGKVDVYLSYHCKKKTLQRVTLNEALAKEYGYALDQLSEMLKMERCKDVHTIAAYQDVLLVEDVEAPKGLEEIILEALQFALNRLDTMRQEEGAHIGEDFLERMDRLQDYTNQLEFIAPNLTEHYKQRLMEKIKALLLDTSVDEARLLQEVAIYADKVDYTEEIVRLHSHFKQFHEIICEEVGPCGRRLDFLLQEINREANTIASKVNNADAAQIVVLMKSELEKIREQVQNLE